MQSPNIFQQGYSPTEHTSGDDNDDAGGTKMCGRLPVGLTTGGVEWLHVGLARYDAYVRT